jgi:hypothetical protein
LLAKEEKSFGENNRIAEKKNRRERGEIDGRELM